MASVLDGLSQAQLSNAQAIVSEAQALGLPLAAAEIAVTTAITESGLLVQANSSVPGSTSYPYQKIGSNSDSVGLFQQRTSWGTLAQRMNPAQSAALFYARLPTGWQSMDPGAVAQKIQVSAYPARYDQNYSLGSQVAQQLWNTNGATLDSATTTGGQTKPKDQYPASGKWVSHSGKAINDPPVVGGNQPSATTEFSYEAVDSHVYTDSEYAAMQTWANSYFDDTPANQTSFTSPYTAKEKQYSNQTAASVIVQNFDLALTDTFENVTYDPGEAQAGVGPVPNPLAALEAIFGWLSNVKNWQRIGLYTLGGLILLIALMQFFKGTAAGGQNTGGIPPAVALLAA